VVSHRICLPLAVALLAIFGLVSNASADMLVRGYQAGANGLDPRYDRFDNSSQFIGAGLDFSGVGQDNSSSVAWATMVSPHFFLSAGHFPPSGTVTFYNTNSLTGGSQQCTVLGGQTLQITGASYSTDVYVGLIGGAGISGSGVTYYPVLDPSAVTVGRSLLVYGKPNRLGPNTISWTGTCDLTTTSGTTVAESMGYEFLYPQTGNPGDAQLMDWDSGGPSFVRIGNQLALVGTHSGADVSAYPYASADTSPSFYISQIDALMATLANTYSVGIGEQLTVIVPEPSSLLLVFVAFVTLLAYAWRRRAA